MSDPELQLEKQRADLLKRIGSVGDLRRGSITATSGKCGKPTCQELTATWTSWGRGSHKPSEPTNGMVAN